MINVDFQFLVAFWNILFGFFVFTLILSLLVLFFGWLTGRL